jgi:hypothetical protein
VGETETCDYLEYRDDRPYCTFTNEYMSNDSAAYCDARDDMDRENCMNYSYTVEVLPKEGK